MLCTQNVMMMVLIYGLISIILAATMSIAFYTFIRSFKLHPIPRSDKILGMIFIISSITGICSLWSWSNSSYTCFISTSYNYFIWNTFTELSFGISYATQCYLLIIIYFLRVERIFEKQSKNPGHFNVSNTSFL